MARSVSKEEYMEPTIDSIPLNTERTTTRAAVLMATPHIAMMAMMFTALWDLRAKMWRFAINELKRMVGVAIYGRCRGGLPYAERSGSARVRRAVRSSQGFPR